MIKDKASIVDVPKIGQYIPVFQTKYDYAAGGLFSVSKAVMVDSSKNGVASLENGKFLCQQIMEEPPLLHVYVDENHNLVSVNKDGTIKEALPTYMAMYRPENDGTGYGSIMCKKGAGNIPDVIKAHIVNERNRPNAQSQLLGSFNYTNAYRMDFIANPNIHSSSQSDNGSIDLKDYYDGYTGGSRLEGLYMGMGGKKASYRVASVSILFKDTYSFVFSDGNEELRLSAGGNRWNDNRLKNYVNSHPEIKTSWSKFTVIRNSNGWIEFLINGEKVLDGQLTASQLHSTINFTEKQALVCLDYSDTSNGELCLLQDLKITAIK